MSNRRRTNRRSGSRTKVTEEGESVARSRGATCAGRVRRRVMANSIRRPPGAPRTVPGTVDGRVSAGPSGGNGYDGATARWSYFAIESRRLARHLPACSTSLSASDWLTRRREGAERGIAVLTRPVGQGCTRRRKRAPRAMRQTRTRVNVSENCYNPVCTSSRITCGRLERARARRCAAVASSEEHGRRDCQTRLPGDCAHQGVRSPSTSRG